MKNIIIGIICLKYLIKAVVSFRFLIFESCDLNSFCHCTRVQCRREFKFVSIWHVHSIPTFAQCLMQLYSHVHKNPRTPKVAELYGEGISNSSFIRENERNFVFDTKRMDHSNRNLSALHSRKLNK